VKYKELRELYLALFPLNLFVADHRKALRQASGKRRYSIRISKTDLLRADRAFRKIIALLHATPEHKRKQAALLKMANSCLLNPDHPDWKPGTLRLLSELARRNNG
jgi:hypothetical protein